MTVVFRGSIRNIQQNNIGVSAPNTPEILTWYGEAKPLQDLQTVGKRTAAE